MIGFSFNRFMAVLRKEWIQVRRDPLTLRMIIALPVLQLFLFGFAINTDPRHLPTGLLSVDHSKYERTIIAALQNTLYYDIKPLASEAEAERAFATGSVLFVINIPPNFDRSVDRGEKPTILMEFACKYLSLILKGMQQHDDIDIMFNSGISRTDGGKELDVQLMVIDYVLSTDAQRPGSLRFIVAPKAKEPEDAVAA